MILHLTAFFLPAAPTIPDLALASGAPVPQEVYHDLAPLHPQVAVWCGGLRLDAPIGSVTDAEAEGEEGKKKMTLKLRLRVSIPYIRPLLSTSERYFISIAQRMRHFTAAVREFVHPPRKQA
ncbi:hypothetical protein SAICODRAFT_16192 [Saitoella complicata NRRL Y-17804]|uniref:uncharacterized protein n=1 Tax=Saitoella complicata (strain BCRC 22490 / CBS 7301 / JCM 7358 / NBRC 10748 / NRRL Y-17804) TaxID=698492 RepID=UPI000867BFCB|nr:uncharacterized protein SAICODRAFT_16192 [Saitoella complicata NRRL Y-17804]ODQ56162.1 hypothetical protein SAICODRAFT_16192 [Saitoella complicata NRRL Y-17804]